jgi:hypothetical protein
MNSTRRRRAGGAGSTHSLAHPWVRAGSRRTSMETEATRPPDDEHLARLLAAAIVADVRRFPPANSWDIIAAEVKPHLPGSPA